MDMEKQLKWDQKKILQMSRVSGHPNITASLYDDFKIKESKVPNRS